MAVVDFNTQDWYNQDQLYIKFGLNRARVTRTGEYQEGGFGRHTTETNLDLVALSAACPYDSGNECIIDDTVTIPAGALIEEVEVVVTEVSAGTNANLDVGLVRRDRSTPIDFKGLIDAGDDWHAAVIGTRIQYTQGSAEHGGLVGTVLQYPGLITASPDTANFTAGVLKIRVKWFVPLPADLVSP